MSAMLRNCLRLRPLMVITLLASSACNGARAESAPAAGRANCQAANPPAFSNGFAAKIGSDHGTGYGIRDVNARGNTSLDIADCSFAPTILRGAPWQTLTIYVTNGSSHLHNFSVPSESVGVDVPPGTTVPVKVQVPGSGGVEFICRFHRAAGMIGAVEVHGADLEQVLPAPPGNLAFGSVGSGAYRGVGHIGPGSTNLGNKPAGKQASSNPGNGKQY